MPMKKAVLRDTIRILKNYADSGTLRIIQNRHTKIQGCYNGDPWIITLPCSPSGHYVERAVRSQIRRLQRQYN